MPQSNSISYNKIGQVELIVVNNRFAQATIALFGAHVMSFIPKTDNRERLWMSENAIYDGKSPLRGGIPICWPWFSDRYPAPEQNLPAHGFVRTQNWQLLSTEESDSGTRLTLAPESTSGPGFAHNTRLSLSVLVGKSLELSLTTQNLENQPISLTAALHTYFSVTDVMETKLSGITGQYHDKTRDYQVFETPVTYTFKEETDRVHHCQSEVAEIQCGQQITQIESRGHDSIVVWNPWKKNSETMQDMPDDGYRNMLCVESAITDGLTIASQASHTLKQCIIPIGNSK